MQAILLLVHLLLAIVLVIIILLQRSEGGALGIGGGGGGMMTGRGAANLLTRATGVIAALFITTSIGLAILGGRSAETPALLVEEPEPVAQEPAEPEAPTVPLSE